MKPALLAIAIAGTLAAQSAPNTAAASIEGRVVNARTGAPIRKSTVRLAILSDFSRTQPLTFESDGEGRFQFTGLPAGRYQLSADHAGFLDQYYGARRSNTPGPSFNIGPTDHITGADLRLQPQGVISGCVLDEDGDPVNAVQVVLLRQEYKDGKKQWVQTATVWTIDTGEYRIPNVVPGRYLVEAVSRKPQTNSHFDADHEPQDKPESIYAPVFYPNVNNEHAASALDVSAGSEIQGIDVHLFKSPAFQIRGSVTGVPPGSGSVFVTFYPASTFLKAGDDLVKPPDYRFDVRGVLADSYTVIANAGNGRAQSAPLTVTVAGNIADLVLPVVPPLSISGQISVAETGTSVKLQGLAVFLHPLINGLLAPSGGQADATGKIRFPSPFPAGHYAVNMGNMPDGCYLKTVKIAGQDASAEDVDISSGAALEIVLSTAAGKITGTVSDKDGKPSSNAAVVLVGSAKDASPQWMTSNDTGGFVFSGLRPDTYQVLAWEDVESGAWEDPEFRKLYSDRATEAKVGPGESQNAQVRVIASGEMK